MTANNFQTTLTYGATGSQYQTGTAFPIYTLQFQSGQSNTGNNPISLVTTTNNLNYPCVVWVTPASGSTVNVYTCIDNKTSAPWIPGPVSVATQQTLNICPGSITFQITGGTTAIVGIT